MQDPDYKEAFFQSRKKWLWQFDENSKILKDALESSMSYLEEIKNIVQTPVTLILIPGRAQVDDNWWNFHKCMHNLQDGSRNVLSLKFIEAVSPIFDAIDLSDHLLENSSTELYFRKDAHWNSKGNKKVSEYLRDMMNNP